MAPFSLFQRTSWSLQGFSSCWKYSNCFIEWVWWNLFSKPKNRDLKLLWNAPSCFSQMIPINISLHCEKKIACIKRSKISILQLVKSCSTKITMHLTKCNSLRMIIVFKKMEIHANEFCSLENREKKMLSHRNETRLHVRE